jgi:hypothetical protein
MNTTQFGFVKSRLPRKPKPMGTIYEPEIAAQAIVYASEHNQREIFVGYSTVKAVIGNKLVPEYADKVLARKGYSGQMTNEPESSNRRNNLWEPIPGDHGAHGPFGNKALKFSLQTWLTLHPILVRGVTAVTAGIISFFFVKNRLGTLKT